MLRFSCRSMLSACFLVGTLYAADGPVLIDQDRAMAGSITPGDDPGFPVTISQPGSYRLTSNLTVTDLNTTAIRITTNSVTLDLNGFSILGPVVCAKDPTICPTPGTGTGIQAAEPRLTRGVRIFNGSVRGMGLQGIQLNGDGSSIEKVTADNNAGGGMSVQGSVTSSTAIQNGSFGIIALLVRDTTALQNAGDGIVLDAGGSAAGNVSSLNGGFGIYSPYGTVIGDTMFLNKAAAVSAICPSVIMNNNLVATNGTSIDTREIGCVVSNNATRP